VLPPFHARIQYADFTKSYYAGMRGLVRALKEREAVSFPSAVF
jgi:hypothetical protein